MSDRRWTELDGNSYHFIVFHTNHTCLDIMSSSSSSSPIPYLLIKNHHNIHKENTPRHLSILYSSFTKLILPPYQLKIKTHTKVHAIVQKMNPKLCKTLYSIIIPIVQVHIRFISNVSISNNSSSSRCSRTSTRPSSRARTLRLRRRFRR